MMRKPQRYPIVAEQQFIMATRETGYHSTASALAELIDNALQAEAKTIEIFVHQEDEGGERGVAIAVKDDGHGMDRHTLRTALQFGGTERFDDRSGQGRFGMGLPNSSVSQARRVEVYSWQWPSHTIYSYLDIDEIASGKKQQIPPPRRRKLPHWVPAPTSRSGTVVIWARCDRLDNQRASTVARKLHAPLGRLFRYFLWSGICMTINGEPLRPIDPLFSHPETILPGAIEFGTPLTYELRLPSDPSRTAAVRVRFSELPIAAWHDWPTPEKRRFGIVNGAGVSIVRANREIDYGWYFMGRKRRENYDDWWRCEVAFEPALDEYFGVTHSKQAINPTPALIDVLSPDMETIARTLNGRARSLYTRVRNDERGPAERLASERDRLLPPLRLPPHLKSPGEPPQGVPPHPSPHSPTQQASGLKYRIVIQPLPDPTFYSCHANDGTIILTINRDHPFFEHIYGPSCQAPSNAERFHLECLLLAAVRAEMEATNKAQSYWYRRKRIAWSDILAAFLGG